MKKDVDIFLSRMGWRSDAGGKESQEGQNGGNLHDEVWKKRREQGARCKKCELIFSVSVQSSLF
jgi:hypothetical protein